MENNIMQESTANSEPMYVPGETMTDKLADAVREWDNVFGAGEIEEVLFLLPKMGSEFFSSDHFTHFTQIERGNFFDTYLLLVKTLTNLNDILNGKA